MSNGTIPIWIRYMKKKKEWFSKWQWNYYHKNEGGSFFVEYSLTTKVLLEVTPLPLQPLYKLII